MKSFESFQALQVRHWTLSRPGAFSALMTDFWEKNRVVSMSSRGRHELGPLVDVHASETEKNLTYRPELVLESVLQVEDAPALETELHQSHHLELVRVRGRPQVEV